MDTLDTTKKITTKQARPLLVSKRPTHPPTHPSLQPTHSPTHPTLPTGNLLPPHAHTPRPTLFLPPIHPPTHQPTSHSSSSFKPPAPPPPNPPTHPPTHPSPQEAFFPRTPQTAPHTPDPSWTDEQIKADEEETKRYAQYVLPTHPPTHPPTLDGRTDQGRRGGNQALRTVRLTHPPTHPPTHPFPTHSTSFQPPAPPPPSYHPPTHPPIPNPQHLIQTASFSSAFLSPTHPPSSPRYWFIHGKPYDLSSFIHLHPGGEHAILLARGRDGTSLFESYHPFSDKPHQVKPPTHPPTHPPKPLAHSSSFKPPAAPLSNPPTYPPPQILKKYEVKNPNKDQVERYVVDSASSGWGYKEGEEVDPFWVRATTTHPPTYPSHPFIDLLTHTSTYSLIH